MINNKLISTFRNYINEESDFILNTFINNNGKNKWNCICSCMDWIDVTVAQLIYLDSQEEHEDINIRVMNFYSFICSIDTLCESIKQLHRVILPKGNCLLEEDKKVFKKCEGFENITDDKYFKEIRSVFGAHPVNLSNGKEKRFASWPSDNIFIDKDHDFSCFLYSNNPQKEDIIFGVNKSELIKYLESRYSYLNDLIEALKEQKKVAYNRLRKQKIQVVKLPLEQLILLKAELQKRYPNDYYESTINHLISFYELDRKKFKNDDIITCFFEKTDKLIDVIKTNIQNMNFYDLEEDFILNPKIPQELHYEYSKVSNKFYTGDGFLPYNLYLDKLEKQIETILEIPKDLTFNERYILIIIGFTNLTEAKEEI